MSILSLSTSSNYKLVIRSDSESILKSFKDYLYTWEIQRFRIKSKKTGETFLKEQKVESLMYEERPDGLYVDTGLFDYLAIHISSLFRLYGPEKLQLKFDVSKPPVITLTEKWRKIFSTHPRGEEFANNQLNDFPVLMGAPGGILEVFTGYGKSEFILACTESMLEQTAGNIVILVPDTSIQDELLYRGRQWDVPIHLYDWTQRVNIIQPVGFLRSRKYNDDAKLWMSNVENALTDECHHLSAVSWGRMFDDMPNVLRSYGYSASVDVSEGTKLTPGNIDIKQLGPKSAAVIAKCGAVKVSRKLPVPVSLLRISCSVTTPDSLEDAESWQAAFDQTILSERLATIIARVFEMHPNRSFFLPIHKKSSGFALYQSLMALKPNGIYWGDDLYVDGELIKKKGSTVEYLKNIMAEKPRAFLMGTRFEGYDIPNLNGMIPLVGTSHRIVTQTTGRSARNEDCLIVLITDRNNGISYRQNAQRRLRIEKEFKVISNKYLSM